MEFEAKFLEWCGGYSFAIGWDRYGSFDDWGFVAIAASNCDVFKDNHFPNEQLTVLVLADYLDAGDQEAIDAAQVIKDQIKYIGLHYNPAMAMTICLSSLRNYYQTEIYKK